MVMVRVTVAAIIIMIMVGIVVSSVTLSGMAPTLAVSLSVVISRCHRMTSETRSTHQGYPDFLILDYRLVAPTWW